MVTHGETIYIVQQGGFASNSGDVTAHLQQQLHQEQTHRLQLENELHMEKERYAQLERQLRQQQNLINQVKQQQEVQLRKFKDELVKGEPLDEPGKRVRPSTKISEPIHICDECPWETKSEVSLILHKLNHAITIRNHLLSTNSFTTRNTNSKSTYCCPACDATSLTRHEVYRHI